MVQDPGGSGHTACQIFSFHPFAYRHIKTYIINNFYIVPSGKLPPLLKPFWRWSAISSFVLWYCLW